MGVNIDLANIFTLDKYWYNNFRFHSYAARNIIVLKANIWN